MNKQEAIVELEKVNKAIETANGLAQDALKALQSIIDAPESDWFVPERSETYYFLTHSNHAYSLNTNHIDANILARQQVFRTEMEAKRADDKRIATTKYLKKIAELNEGWKPDWSDRRQSKYQAYYAYDDEKIGFTSYTWLKSKDSAWYSVSEKAAQAAIDSLTENEIELIFKS